VAPAWLARLVAGALVALATGWAMPAPAHAAACSSAEGVTVVVDNGGLGGGVSQLCAENGGGDVAATILDEAGFDLTYVQRQPGFVCRIDGLPTVEQDDCVNTPPADAYWGLFWSDGTSGKWSYATLGVGSLKVPDGGSVAMAWQGTDDRRIPSVRPPKNAPTSPSTSATPTQSPSQSPSTSPTSQAPTTSAAPTTQPTSTAPTTAAPTTSATSGESSPTAEPTRSESPKHTKKPQKSPSAGESPDQTPVASGPIDPSSPDDGGGVPLWVVLVVLGALGAGATWLTLSRRVT